MTRIASRSLLGGGLLFVVGAGASLIALANYPAGSLAFPGPGLFPAALGAIVATLGVGIVLQGWGGDEAPIEFDGRSAFAILAAVIAFAVTIRPLGLLPAVTATVLIARFAEPGRYGLAGTLALAAAAAAGTWVLFVALLDAPIATVRWPF